MLALGLAGEGWAPASLSELPWLQRSFGSGAVNELFGGCFLAGSLERSARYCRDRAGKCRVTKRRASRELAVCRPGQHSAICFLYLWLCYLRKIKIRLKVEIFGEGSILLI